MNAVLPLRRMLLGLGLGLVGVGVLSFTPAALAQSAGPSLSFDPSSWTAGPIGPGTTTSQTFTLLNSGGSASGTVTVTLSGSEGFTKAADTCTAKSLGPGKSCSVTVQYRPTSNGESDTATLTANGEHASASASLSGSSTARATPALSTTPDPEFAPAGRTVTLKDSATLSGGFNPTGTVNFELSRVTGGTVDNESVNVSGNGTYTTPTGYTFTATSGDYLWIAVYSGDPHNNSAVSPPELVLIR